MFLTLRLRGRDLLSRVICTENTQDMRERHLLPIPIIGRTDLCRQPAHPLPMALCRRHMAVWRRHMAVALRHMVLDLRTIRVSLLRVIRRTARMVDMVDGPDTIDMIRTEYVHPAAA
jgi:hypothetical protein